MKSEEVVKAYHLLEELRQMRLTQTAFKKEGSSLEVTGHLAGKVMFSPGDCARFSELMDSRIGEIQNQLVHLGVMDINP